MAIFRKKKKKKGLLKKALTFMILPIAISLGIAFVWWANDQFWLYAQLFVLNNEVSTSNGTPNSVAIGGNNWGINGAGTGGSGAGSSYGVSGLNLALVNQMSAGYCKDYLEILQSHADWTYMNKETRLSSEPLPLNTLLGMSGTETGTNVVTVNGESLQIPGSAIRYSEYDTVDGLNFYTATSAWFAQNGLQYIDVPTPGDAGWMQWGDTSTDGGGTAHTTVLQFHKEWFSIYPAGRYDGGASSYPSLMNTGYGIDPNAVRTSADLDAAYFPDMISVQIQSAPGRLLAYADIDSIKDFTTALSAMHVGHHGDLSVIDIGTGAYAGQNTTYLLSSSSPHTTQEAVSGSLNMYSDMMNDIFSYLNVHISDADIDIGTDYDAFAIGLGYMLYKYNAFFITEGERQTCIEKFTSSNWYGIQIRRGMRLGFLIASGREWTDNQIESFLRESARVRSLPGGYPSNLVGRYHNSLDVYWFYIYVQDPEIDVIYNAGDGSVVPALHAWHKVTLGAALRDPLKGSYVFWEMLRVGGVDCTFDEVLGAGGSSSSNLIEQIPTYTNVAVPSTVNAVAATIAVMYAWTTRDEGLTTWGTALYRRGWHDVIANDWITRSCDRCAMTAVYWAGMTNSKTVTYGGCSNIIKNLDSEVKLGHFEKVKEFDGTPSTIQYLMPGDIIINSGHIMLYVGSDIVQAIYPGVDSEYDMVHGSIGSRNQVYYEGSAARSPNLDKLKNNLSTSNGAYMAYRCLVPMSDPKHTDAISATEMLWLFNNPKAGVYLCTFNSSGKVTNRSEFLNGLPYMP